VRDDEVLELWNQRWLNWPPSMPDGLRQGFPNRWVRFHSLPESKRYPSTEGEYETALDRYNTVLDELFAGHEIYLITSDWCEAAEPGPRPVDHARWHPDARYWTSTCRDPDNDPIYTHVYLSRMAWHHGCLDDLLRAVADYATAGVVIADLTLECIYHPYDGGADVLLPTVERDVLRSRHSGWLSVHPAGL
jgi:hypothetical protein